MVESWKGSPAALPFFEASAKDEAFASSGLQMPGDELLRSHRLGFIAGVSQRLIIAVIRQDEIGMRGDGAVRKGVVIRDGWNGLKAEGRVRVYDRPVRVRDEREELLQLLPVPRAPQLLAHLLILQPDGGRQRHADLPIADGLHQPPQRALPSEHADHHIRVEDDGHVPAA